jgi:hypothetical protein
MFTHAVSLAVGVAPTVYVFDPSAFELVKQAMLKDNATTYSCVRVMYAWEADEAIRVRRDQASNGAHKVVVLAPTQKQGYTIVDNGKQWITYDPDRQFLRIQDSPLARLGSDDAKRRFEILRRNYMFRFRANEEVANRTSAKVTLFPKDRSRVYTRNYWIDRETYVLLKVELVDPSGKSRVVSDTMTISYPAKLPPETFDVRFVGKPREIRLQSPVPHESLAKLSEAVEFTVVNPIKMPLGLTLSRADSVRTRSQHMAALRYTDGVSNVTLYQVADPGRGAPWGDRSNRTVNVDGVAVLVEGDLPEVGIQRVISDVRESTRERDAALRARAEAQFRSAASVVSALRGMGLTYDEVVWAMAAGKDSQRAERAGKRIRSGGVGPLTLAREFDVKDWELRAAQKRFWNTKEN